MLQIAVKRILQLFFLFLLFTSYTYAQTNQALNAAEILQGLEKLNTLGSVLYIAAHPDDENTRLLAYLSKGRNLRTGYLSLTRGDGGQNLLGKETGELLGVIRTQELLAARRIDGAEQFFTRANDFGYSKNPEETFGIWTKDSILSDVVWCIRLFKPDVIVCRFPTTGEGGHGHHTASAILAMAAFTAAADPKQFPEQLTYTEVWQAKRIMWNTFNFGTTNTTAPDQLKVDVGVFNPLLGKGYGELASESRSMHKSQGFGSAKTRGTSIEYFKYLQGDTTSANLFAGIDQTWKRIGQPSFTKTVDGIIKEYDPQHPELIVPDLVDFYKQLQQVDEGNATTKYWKQEKLKELQTLILACSGIWLEAAATDYIAVPGSTITITAQAIMRNKGSVKLNRLIWPYDTDTPIDTITTLPMKYNELYSFKHKAAIAENTPYSSPYWLNQPHTQAQYVVNNHLLIGKPENDAAEEVIFYLDIDGLPLSILRPIIYKYTDPVKGEVYRPLEVLPPATVNLSEKVYVFAGNTPRKISFTVKANKPYVTGTLNVKVPSGWAIDIKNSDFILANKGDETVIEATITPGSNSGTISASATIDGKTYSKSITRIDYDHIPNQFVLSDASAKLVNVNLKKTGTNIGYIPGAGDDVAACLKQVGFNVTILTNELIANSDLSKYNAIVTGVRAYNINDQLPQLYNKLMDYIKNGGNLIVQYNTNSQIGPAQNKIGPYPFTISRDRVTDETAQMRMINPADSVLNYPNKITNADFDNWIQERGIYFVNGMDKNYRTVFSINDPMEKPSEGSLIIARYGKGNFAYTGLDFFRELPAGVPGAYRLFTNLLSLPTAK